MEILTKDVYSIYAKDITARYSWLSEKGYDFTDKEFTFEEKNEPNVIFEQLKEGMHLYIHSRIEDTITGKKLNYDVYEIEIVHIYADVLFFNIIDHPEITIQHAVKGGVGFDIMFYPYSVIAPSYVNLVFEDSTISKFVNVIKV